MKEYRYIEVKEGNEYHALVDSSKNIYNEKNFFYPVYAKSAKLVNEICRNSNKESSKDCKDKELEHKDFSNNIIMYCAERGGGKSTAMLSFANALKDFREDYNKQSDEFVKMWGTFSKAPFFLVLSVIDPTEISESELFLRIVFSKMFSLLRDKWKKEDSKIHYEALMNGEMNCKKLSRNIIIKKFTECYRYLDVIYQKKGQFEYDDDLDDLTDLGDSGKLKEKFWDLVNSYLEEMIGFKESKAKSNFLVIQIDDADLNSGVTYKMIEDIRKYCIIPNVIILMSVNIAQMHYVLEQNFVSDFKTLLDISKVGDNDGDARSIHLRDCQKMAMRYIDKIMPAAHQIHLPKFEDLINNNTFDLKIMYNTVDEANDSKIIEILTLKDKSEKEITDYQEIFINLIYNKTGIAVVKPDGYLHNILPKTLRGLSHFLAYMCQLPDLDKELGMAQINELLNVPYAVKPMMEIKGKNKSDAEVELRKRIDNLEALRIYFLKNWCTVRLTKRYQEAIEDINKTVVELKVKTASQLIDRLFENKFKFTDDDAPLLSPSSYAFLREKLHRLTLQAHSMEGTIGVYHFAYALRFYFLLEFNRTFLSCVQNGGNFNELLKLTNCEMWAPSVARLDKSDPLTSFGHFKINYDILEKYKKNTEDNTGNGSEAKPNKSSTIVTAISELNKGIIIRSGGENYFFVDLKNVNKDVDNDADKKGDKEIDSIPKDADFFVDLGSSLLYSLIYDWSYNDNTETYYSNLNYKNCLIALLSSWELQRYAEKKAGFIFGKVFNNLGKANQQFIREIFACLNQIEYLPIEWTINESQDPTNQSANSDISILMFANREAIPSVIEMLLESFQENSGNSKEMEELLGSKLYGFSDWESKSDKIRMLSVISDKAKEVYNLASKIYTKDNTKSQGQESVSNKDNEEWKRLIEQDHKKTVKGITDEVLNAFGGKELQPEEAVEGDEDKKTENVSQAPVATGNPQCCLKLIIDNEFTKEIATLVISMLDERKQQSNTQGEENDSAENDGAN